MKFKIFLFIFSILIIFAIGALIWMFLANRAPEERGPIVTPTPTEIPPTVTPTPIETTETIDFCKDFAGVKSVYSCVDAMILALREVKADYGGGIQKISRETIEGTDMWLVSIKLDHPHFAEAFGRVISEVLVGVRLDGKDGPKTSYKQVLESSEPTHSQ